MELRCPDATGNVYMQFATLIFMGLDGIANKDDAGQPDMGSTYKKDLQPKVRDDRFLPRDFFPALMAAEDSAFMSESLGKELFDNYMKIKIAEWEDYRTTVTDYEHQNYMEI
jgi:glutamine synthetase